MIVDRLGMAASVVILSGAVAAALGAQGTVSLLGYTAAVPAGWVTAPSTSSMRLAQYTIPGRDGSVAAEVVVYFFGKGQGGNVAANLERWKGQFSTPDGTPVFEKVTRDSSGAFPVTIAEYRGTYARGIGAGDTVNAKPGQSLIAAIAETPKGTLFFQLFGATANVTPQRVALVAFVRSLRASAETGGGAGGCEIGDGFECIMITGHEDVGQAERQWARAILLWKLAPRERGRVAFDTLAVRIAHQQNVVARRAAEDSGRSFVGGASNERWWAASYTGRLRASAADSLFVHDRTFVIPKRDSALVVMIDHVNGETVAPRILGTAMMSSELPAEYWPKSWMAGDTSFTIRARNQEMILRRALSAIPPIRDFLARAP